VGEKVGTTTSHHRGQRSSWAKGSPRERAGPPGMAQMPIRARGRSREHCGPPVIKAQRPILRDIAVMGKRSGPPVIISNKRSGPPVITAQSPTQAKARYHMYHMAQGQYE
jgi:hypothetical protein